MATGYPLPVTGCSTAASNPTNSPTAAELCRLAAGLWHQVAALFPAAES